MLLGLHQLGIWKFKSLERTWKLPFQKKGSVNAVIAFLMGFTFSFAWTPCIGPALSSILLLASSSGSLWVSTFLMIVYALGFTIPFLILGLFTGKVLHWISNHKNIMNIAVKLGAVILIAIGLMMFTGKMNTISSYMSTSDKATAKRIRIRPHQRRKRRLRILRMHRPRRSSWICSDGSKRKTGIPWRLSGKGYFSEFLGNLVPAVST